MYDVIIIGSGIAGSVLGSILARNDAKVLLIDAGKHPRFAIGESTVRDTTKLMALLGDVYDVPELHGLAGFVNVTREVSKRCGMKRNFGFTYHEDGKAHDPDKIYQVVIPDAFDGPEAHYYRADVDHHMVKVAQGYGAELLEETRIQDVDFHDWGVEVTTTAGDRYQARYIVDGAGFRSPLAQKFDLREQPPRMKTHARAMFTHMTGVKPYEQVAPETMERVPRRWSQGTLHHCFHGGWLWVIPFNNGPDGDAHNASVSVGFQLDPRIHPFNPDVSPEEEFNALLDRFPSLKAQFADAEVTRKWTRTGPRMQYSSKRTIGDRFWLAPHAAGFIDPLYSRGLPITLSAMVPMADALLKAIADDDFSTARFEGVDELVQRSLDRADDLVHGSYTSWRNFDLWNAWVRVWYTSVNLSTMHIAASHQRFNEGGTREQLIAELYQPVVGSFCPPVAEFQAFFKAAVDIIEAVDAGRTDAEDAAAALFALLRDSPCVPPVFNLGSPEARYGGKFDATHWKRLVRWGNFDSPASVKEQLFAGDPTENLISFDARYEAFFQEEEMTGIQPFLDATVAGAA